MNYVHAGLPARLPAPNQARIPSTEEWRAAGDAARPLRFLRQGGKPAKGMKEMDGNGYDFPGDLCYDRTHHMWVRGIEEENRAVIGIDMLGLASLGDLAYIVLNEAGATVRRGESIGTLEAAKMTGDFIAPVSGVLLGRNAEALRNPALVNEDPYGRGWLVEIAPADWSGEISQLVAGSDVPPWVNSELERFRSEGWIE